jgi:ribonucleoside-diphosphate reductase alpha chain
MSNLLYKATGISDAVAAIMMNDDFSKLILDENGVNRTLDSFGGDLMASTVFLKKYALKDRKRHILEYTMDESKDRWAASTHGAEKLFGPSDISVGYFRELYDYFSPAGRQMYALGNDFVKKASFSNCYMIAIEEDSIEGIFDASKKIARTFSYGGGVGTCLGPLRPRLSIVSNTAEHSTGAVSFAPLLSHITGLIGQKSRRGALLISLPVNHPDIFDFVELKHKDKTAVENANISIKISDEFMEAVVADRDFDLVFETAHERICRTIRAKELWKKIIKAARDFGDPGLLFWDTAVSLSPSEPYQELKVASTNPCITKDMWIHTAGGPRQVKELIGEAFVARVQGKEHSSTSEGFFYTGTKDVYKLSTKEGYSIKATTNEKLLVVSKSSRDKLYTDWKELGDIQKGDKMLLSNQRMADYWEGWYGFDEGYMLGLMVGDGCLNQYGGILDVWKKDIGYEGMMMESEGCMGSFTTRSDFLGWREARAGDKYRMKFSSLRDLAFSLGMSRGHKDISSDMEKCSSSFYKGFLRGFFDTDGSIQGNQKKGVSVRLGQVDLCRLYVVQRMLLRLGIFSTIYKNRKKESKKLMPDGRGGQGLYVVKAFHELVIANDNISIFSAKVGFSHTKKKEVLSTLLAKYKRKLNRERFVAVVEKIEYVGKEEVFDATIDEIHMFDANGFYAHNCGEIFLEPSGACLLGSLILDRFVKYPYTDRAEFDLDLFREMTTRAIRHLDNVLELNIPRHPLQAQREKAALGRRIGLGVTGLADALASLGMRYDEDVARSFTDILLYNKMVNEYSATIELSRERGAFPLFDPDKHYCAGFAQKLPDEVKELGRKYGQRNVSVSTVAPNGSLSIVTQGSNGMEPIFDREYDRKVMLGGEPVSYHVVHPGISRYLAVPEQDRIPDPYVTAHEIDYHNRIKLQGKIQEYVDGSISSTINLPEDTDVGVVEDIYMEAWKAGCKGITVYRENARENVLTSSKKGSIRDKQDTIHYKFLAEGGEKFHVLVSYHNGDISEPYQVFVLNYRATENDSFIKISNAIIRMLAENDVDSARIEKHSHRSLDTTSLNKLARFISLAMKTGNFIACLKILHEYAYIGSLASKLCLIFEYNKLVGVAKCANCGSSNVRSEGGCTTCLDCGSDACGG